MDEKDKNSLTVGDILDQLVRPSVLQGPLTPPPVQPKPTPPSPASPSPLPRAPLPGNDLKLPQLGGEISPQPDNNQKKAGPAELRLSIRTMKDDLEKLKRGEAPSAFEVNKNIKPAELPKTSPPREISPQPKITELPKIRSPFTGRSHLPSLPKPGERPAHIHEEIEIADKQNVPSFLGAPAVKKKTTRPEDEKVEYGLIARVIGRGMTTGIITVLLMAIGLYALVYVLFLKEDPIINIMPTPVATNTPPVRADELETIFGSIPVSVFTAPSDNKQAMTEFKSFMENESLAKKEFRRIKVKITDQEKPNLRQILSKLSINYPQELNGLLKENNLLLLYRQDEVFSGTNESGKRIVLVTEVTEVNKVAEVMGRWEATIANDLKDIFAIDQAKQASTVFLENERQGVKIKYRNYPLPDKSIDYAIVTSLTGRHYLVLTNSRESMFSPLDKIKGL